MELVGHADFGQFLDASYEYSGNKSDPAPIFAKNDIMLINYS